MGVNLCVLVAVVVKVNHWQNNLKIDSHRQILRNLFLALQILGIPIGALLDDVGMRTDYALVLLFSRLVCVPNEVVVGSHRTILYY